MLTKLASASACLTAALALAACGTSGGSGGASAENYPEEPLEWTVAFGPGGGNDIMSRTIVDILEKEKLYPENITVENVDGGSGAKGWSQVYGEAGNPYSISSTSGSFLTTPLEADTGWAPEDFTHIGLLATDASLFLTHKKSGQDTWEKWVKYAKSEEKVPVGGIGVVNVDLILHQELAEPGRVRDRVRPVRRRGRADHRALVRFAGGDHLEPRRGPRPGGVGRHEPAAVHRRGAMPGLPEVPTAPVQGLHRHGDDAAGHDPAPGRAPGDR